MGQVDNVSNSYILKSGVCRVGFEHNSYKLHSKHDADNNSPMLSREEGNISSLYDMFP